MKRICLLLTLLAPVLGLWACSGQEAPEAAFTQPPAQWAAAALDMAPTPLPEASSASNPAPEASPAVPPSDGADGVGQEAQALLDILTELSQGFYPGTAGSSLTSARFAGELMDWYAREALGSEEIVRAVGSFYASLEPEAAALFSAEQLPGVYGAALTLLDDGAAELLETAGYQAQALPYDQSSVSALFTALYDGIGLELPA